MCPVHDETERMCAIIFVMCALGIYHVAKLPWAAALPPDARRATVNSLSEVRAFLQVAAGRVPHSRRVQEALAAGRGRARERARAQPRRLDVACLLSRSPRPPAPLPMCPQPLAHVFARSLYRRVCGTKYKTVWGMILEMVAGGNIYDERVPLPHDDIQDHKAMCVDKFNGAAVQTPEAFLAPPRRAATFSHRLKEGTYGIPTDIFAAMPQMTWGVI